CLTDTIAAVGVTINLARDRIFAELIQTNKVAAERGRTVPRASDNIFTPILMRLTNTVPTGAVPRAGGKIFIYFGRTDVVAADPAVHHATFTWFTYFIFI